MTVPHEAGRAYLRNLASNLSYPEVFNLIYRNNLWLSAETRAGQGAEFASMANVIPRLEDLLRSLGVVSILDAACGAFHWMRNVDFLDAGIMSYTGVDIVEDCIQENQRLYAQPKNPLITFAAKDIATDPLPKVDLILCRSTFIHFSNWLIMKTVANFRRSGSTYLLTSNTKDVEENYPDINSGDSRKVNLCRPPFDFPPPVAEISDPGHPDYVRLAGEKILALWRLEDLSVFG